MPQEISNERLQQIAAEAAKKLPQLIGEREEDILSDFHAAVQDAHDDEDAKMPKLKLAFALEYDLQTSMLGLALKWTVSRKTSEVVQIEDPDQQKLNFEEGE
jgi:hypothetical protein